MNEGNLFSSSVLKNLALFKKQCRKLKQNKAHGFGICCLFSVAVRPHVLAMFLYVVCVFVCVCLCACCETLRTCTVVYMSFLCYVFLGCDVVF